MPNEQQLIQVLKPLHDEGRHRFDIQTLVKALTVNGFTLPRFTGGLGRACRL